MAHVPGVLRGFFICLLLLFLFVDFGAWFSGGDSLSFVPASVFFFFFFYFGA